MERRPLVKYIHLGASTRVLFNAHDEASVGGLRLAHEIRTVIDYLEEFELRVCAELAKTGAGYKPLEQLATEFEAMSDEATLDGAQATALHDAVADLEKMVAIEARIKYVYSLLPKRFDLDRLTDDVGALFAPGVFKDLPDQVKFDLTEAARCIAFERPTAAAFHTMRAIEGELRNFYLRWVKQNRLKDPLWKPMLDQLAARSKAPPQSLLDQLDSIRQHFRNPTQHPDANYDIYEAQELFSGAIDTISRMARTDP